MEKDGENTGLFFSDWLCWEGGFLRHEAPGTEGSFVETALHVGDTRSSSWSWEGSVGAPGVRDAGKRGPGEKRHPHHIEMLQAGCCFSF